MTVSNLYAFIGIREGLVLDCQSSSITDATITMTAGSINIQGTAGNITNGKIVVNLSARGNSMLKSDIPYTLTMSGSSSTHSISFFPKTNLTYSEIYRDSKTAILTPLSNGYPMLQLVINNVSANDNINVTFNACAVYEGEFKNPPIKNSLDVLTNGKQFLNSNLTNAPYFLGLITGSGRTGMWADSNFTYFSNAQSGMFEYLFDAIEFTGGAGDPAHPIHISVDMYVFGSGMWANLSAIKYNIEVHAYTVGANNIVVKAATLTQDSSYPVTKADNHTDSYTPAYTIRATPFKNVANNPSLAIYIKQTNANASSGYYHVFHVKQMIEPDAANASTDTKKHTWYLLHGVKRMNSTYVFSTRMDYTVS